MTKTSHTTFDVELVIISNTPEKYRLLPEGKLADIAPTMLKMLGVPIPEEMTGEVLLID